MKKGIDTSSYAAYNIHCSRGISAVGSAFEWHSKGQGFDSPMLHHEKGADDNSAFSFFPYRYGAARQNERSALK